MRLSSIIRTLLPLVLLQTAWLSVAQGADPAEPKPKTGLLVWDTGQPSVEPFGEAALAGKSAWTAIAIDKTADSFKGDAVVSNDRIIAVVRKKGATVEISTVAVHDAMPDSAVSRMKLRLLTATGEPAASLDKLALIENAKGGICLEAAFKTAKGAEVVGKFRFKRGDVAVQVEPRTGASKLRVECPGRFVVLPDFFADDIVIDAAKLPVASAELPSENFVLHLTGKGDAIAMCVFENRQQDVKVTLAGEGDKRIVTGSEIGFENKKVWVALMEAPAIWQSKDLKAEDTGKVVSLDWTMPFVADWRVDFPRPNGLTDSWAMLLQDRAGGSYEKPSFLGSGADRIGANRKRWNTVLGDFSYPCWSDAERKGYVQPLRSKVLKFQGTAVIYPINRVKQTPLDAYTVVDVMRNTLGVGPCQHILDLEGQKIEYRGMATCESRDRLNAIYSQGQQKEKRADADKILDNALAFVKHIRGRITRYVEFGQKMGEYLAEQKKAHPELKDSITELETLNHEIDKRYARRKEEIKTPEYVAKMNEDFRKNILDNTGPDAAKQCKKYAEALVEVGDNQDELSGECRYAIKTLRQRAGIMMALDQRMTPIATEIRNRTQEVLRNPANHEGARH